MSASIGTGGLSHSSVAPATATLPPLESSQGGPPRDQLPQGQIIITTHCSGPWVTIQIEDNGVGVKEEAQDKLFESFFTTKSAERGTGLGLSISHHIIVDKHGGSIDYQSCRQPSSAATPAPESPGPMATAAPVAAATVPRSTSPSRVPYPPPEQVAASSPTRARAACPDDPSGSLSGGPPKPQPTHHGTCFTIHLPLSEKS
ncbi:MAG: sensor histidine kinase [Prochlorothrix sp.]